MSGLTIRQVERPRPGVEARELRLDGSLAPIDRLSFGGEQRAQVEWLPGSSVASVRLDGPSESSTDMSFRWRGRRFVVGEATLDGTPLLSLDAVVDAFEALRRDTALVKVVWRGREYTGVLSELTFEEGLAHEIDVNATFQWVAPADYVATGQKAPPQPASAFAAELQAAFDEGMAGVAAAVTFARRYVEGASRTVSRVRESISRISQAAGSIKNVFHDAAAVNKGVADGFSQLKITTDDVIDELGVAASTVAQSDDAAQQIFAAGWLARLTRANRVARHQVALERRNYRYESDLLGWHNVSAGETVFSVAVYWYGDARHARVIARRNHLFSSVLRAGQRLMIPRLEVARG